jgi:hypothetical protein
MMVRRTLVRNILSFYYSEFSFAERRLVILNFKVIDLLRIRFWLLCQQHATMILVIVLQKKNGLLSLIIQFHIKE